jgi:subtilisin family serine protease
LLNIIKCHNFISRKLIINQSRSTLVKQFFTATTILMLLLSSVTLSQTQVSQRLINYMRNSGENDYIRTLVFLRDQVDLEELNEILESRNASMEERAYTVITALQQKAASTQNNLKSFIASKEASREVFSHQSFWVANAFMIECRKSVIEELATRMDIAEIDLDAELKLDPYTIEAVDTEGTETVEAGVRIINAHKLWELGITGQGRLVMGIDTGVLLTHPTVSHKWRGNTVPHWQAWFDPSAGTTTPNDCDGHGTHTMGTMQGRSLTTADTVGVAIDAQWIASNSLCGGGTHTSRSIASFQWAMNPDSNAATISDMPDAICNSWHDPQTVNQCAGLYKQVFDAVEAAGIAIVFSAGNSGPNASTITMPKNINTDDVNVFAIGAIDGGLYLGGSNTPIASFSSRGPSVCGGTGSLLIKPEVSAPGVNVRSASGASGYGNLSGTSMAAPHVTGAIALLRQAFPNKTGRSIKLALYYTAKDLGAAGEDNIYGKGLIDVHAAYLALLDTTAPSAITTITTSEPTSNGLKVNWTVPAGPSISGYDIRYSNAPIPDEAAFNAATQFVFTTSGDTAGQVKSFVLRNLTPAVTYYVRIKSIDMWGNYSPMSVQLSGTTLGAPKLSYTPASISHTIYNATVLTDTVTLSNISAHQSTLDYTASFDNNQFPSSITLVTIPEVPSIEAANESKDNPIENGGVSIRGQGGPDAFGYKWIDSDEPNGPQYVWEDIVATGTLTTNWTATSSFNAKDEGYTGPYPLGFNFKFYGQTYSQLYINANGFVNFLPLTTSIITNPAIPTAAAPNAFIAAFFDDLDGSAQGNVYYKADPDKFIVQFDNWKKYGTTSSSLTFQMVIYKGGRIMVYYKNMTGTLNSATVGIENHTGTVGLQIVRDANYVKNNHAIKFAAEPDWVTGNNSNGTIFNGNNVKMIISINSEDFPVGNYSMDLKINSNDPTLPTVTIPIQMTLAVVPVELSALSVKTSKNEAIVEWTTATEVNNMGFSIERKDEKGTWNEIGFIKGAGSSTQNNNYSYSDKNLSIGSYSYRLKQIDFDGTFEFSEEVNAEITAPNDFTLYQNYPNPFNPSTSIEFSLPVTAEVSISIYNTLGELVTDILKGSRDAGFHKVAFDASNLPSGTYIYQIIANYQGGNFTDTKKMVLLK